MEKDSADVDRMMNENKRESYPARGKRYSHAQKREILEYARTNDVQSAALKFGTTETSIYEWRRSLKRRGGNSDPGSKIELEDPKTERDQRILGIVAPPSGVWAEPDPEHAETERI